MKTTKEEINNILNFIDKFNACELDAIEIEVDGEVLKLTEQQLKAKESLGADNLMLFRLFFREEEDE